MKKYLPICLMIIQIMFLVGCRSNTSDPIDYCKSDPTNDGLSMILETSSGQYRIGEEINLSVTFINISQENIVFNANLPVFDSPSGIYPLGELAINIHDSEGKWIKYRKSGHDVDLLYIGDFIVLGPGESYTKVVNLFSYFYLDAPGKYSIEAAYCNGYDSPDGDEAWKGFIQSNEINIEIID